MDKLAIGILAHVDAGKTTLSEGMMYLTGMLRRMGRVDHGDAFLDNFALERSRGITIFSKQAVFRLGDKEITLLDTPGHVDFSAEMERTLSVLDYAVLVVSGPDGVQGHTETLWRLLREYRIPTFLFINKMDQEGADRDVVLENLKDYLGDGCLPFDGDEDYMESEEFQEALAMCDEETLEYYLDGHVLKDKDIVRLIRKRKVFPCWFGSALKLEGVEEFLSGLARFTRMPDYPETFGAKVYKVSRDEQGNRLSHLKVTGGSLKVKMGIGDENEEKIDQIRIYSGSKYQLAEMAGPGTVCAVTGLSATAAGMGLGVEEDTALPVLTPVLACQLILPEDVDVVKALRNLRELEEEEPQLHVMWNPQLAEIQVQLMGEVQTEILASMIEERYHMKVEFGREHIMYRESIKGRVVGVGHYEPLRHYAEVHLRLSEGEPGSGLVFESECSEDRLDRNWQRLIMTHLYEKDHLGVLTGSPITDMKITITDGRAHLKHTEGGDFRQSTYRAVRQGLMEARAKGQCVLLEPWFAFRMELPAEQIGRGMADVTRMAGTFDDPEISGDRAVLTGKAPVSEMMDYQKEVWSYTGGRGRLTLKLAGYQPCHNPDEVIEEYGYDPEADTDNPSGSIFCAHGAGFFVPWNQVPEYMHIKGAREDAPGQEEGPEYPDSVDISDRPGTSVSTDHPESAGFSDQLEEEKELKKILDMQFRRKEGKRSGYGRTSTVLTFDDKDSSPESARTEGKYKGTARSGQSGEHNPEKRKDAQMVDGQKENSRKESGRKADSQKENTQRFNYQKVDGQKENSRRVDEQKSNGQKENGRRVDEQKLNSQKENGQRQDGRKSDGQKDNSRKINDQKINRKTKRNKEQNEKDYLLVDGYNIIFAWEELKSLAESNLDAARNRLADILCNYQGFVGCEVILVFDAYKVKGNQREISHYHNIYVVFTREAETADQYIEKTTHELRRNHKVRVATSDALEQVIVMGQGAERISARDFLEEVEMVVAAIRKAEIESRKSEKNYLFNHMDEDLADEMEQVRLGEKELSDIKQGEGDD